MSALERQGRKPSHLDGRRAISVRSRRRFLEHLAEGWSVTSAAAFGGHHRATFYRLRDDDPGFAEEWMVALEAGTDVLEDEARRRAFEGWEEPVFQGGVQVGAVRKFSDRLLELLLRARRPHLYREAQVAITGPTTFVLESSFAKPAIEAGVVDAVAVELPAGDGS